MYGMTRPRIVQPGATLALSRRTTRRHFLLHPDEARQMEQVYWYCLAERLLGVQATLDEHWPDFESLRSAPPKTTDKLYVIRESISATAIDYRLSRETLTGLGGEVVLGRLAEARADLQLKYEERVGFVLSQRLQKRMQVAFLAEQILPSVPTAAKPEAPRVVYFAQPVDEALFWKEAATTTP